MKCTLPCPIITGRRVHSLLYIAVLNSRFIIVESIFINEMKFQVRHPSRKLRQQAFCKHNVFTMVSTDRYIKYYIPIQVLLRDKEQRNILHEISKWKANWIGHILCKNYLLQRVIEGKIKGGI